MTLIVATMEYASVSGAEPVVLVGEDENVIRREAARVVARHLANGELEEVTLDRWVAEGNPAEPDYADPDAVKAWQEQMWEWTTEMRLTIYRSPEAVEADKQYPYSEPYIDTRGDTGATETSGDAVKAYDHDARPSDDAEPGDHCKDCGEDITWMGPTAVDSITDPGYKVDWLHCDDERN